MEDLIYTPEFYGALKQLVDKRPHKCKGCGVADGTRKHNKDGTKQKFERIVRLCVDDPTQPPNDPNNIAYFCTRCRKPHETWRTPRSLKPSKLPQLFDVKVNLQELSILEKLRLAARNKVPPKAPVVDDDGNEIPF